MAEYIEREALEKWLLTEAASLDGEEDRQYVVERLRNEIPAADVRPVVRESGRRKMTMCATGLSVLCVVKDRRGMNGELNGKAHFAQTAELT